MSAFIIPRSRALGGCKDRAVRLDGGGETDGAAGPPHRIGREGRRAGDGVATVMLHPSPVSTLG